MKKIIFVSVVALIFFCNIPSAFCNETAEVPELKKFTLGVGGMHLKDLLPELEKHSGYKIILGKELGDVVVVGNYVNTTLDKFLMRVFKEKSITIEYDEKNSKVVVQSFARGTGVDPEPIAVVTPEKEMTIAEGENSQRQDSIKKMQLEQLKELERQKNDPDAIDSFSGMRRGDMKELHNEQYANIETEKEDPNTIASMSGIPIIELRSMHKEQREALAKQQNDLSAVHSFSGATIGDLNKKQDEQLAAFDRMKNNPDAIHSFSGVRLGDLKRLHEKQLAEIKK